MSTSDSPVHQSDAIESSHVSGPAPDKILVNMSNPDEVRNVFSPLRQTEEQCPLKNNYLNFTNPYSSSSSKNNLKGVENGLLTDLRLLDQDLKQLSSDITTLVANLEPPKSGQPGGNNRNGSSSASIISDGSGNDAKSSGTGESKTGIDGNKSSVGSGHSVIAGDDSGTTAAGSGTTAAGSGKSGQSSGSDIYNSGPSFYVSASGNDTGNGSIEHPFATLQEAARAMESSSSINSTIVEAGSYKVDSALHLTNKDNGETFEYDKANGVDTAVFNGGDAETRMIDIEGGSNITINGLHLTNFQSEGIFNHGGTVDRRDKLSQDVGAALGNRFVNNEIDSNKLDWRFDHKSYV